MAPAETGPCHGAQQLPRPGSEVSGELLGTSGTQLPRGASTEVGRAWCDPPCSTRVVLAAG